MIKVKVFPSVSRIVGTVGFRRCCRVLVLSAVCVATIARSAPLTAQQANASTPELVQYGYLFGVSGFVSGGMIGPSVERQVRRWIGRPDTTCGQTCGATGAIALSVLGGSTGVAAGVHLADDSRGDFREVWLASIAVGVAGSATMLLVDRLAGNSRDPGRAQKIAYAVGYIVAIPAAQIATAIHIERAESEAAGRAAITVPLVVLRMQ